MKFLVNRTSVWRHEEQAPCPEAVKFEGTTKLYNGEVKPTVDWIIELNSLEELMSFMVKQQEPLVLKDVGLNWSSELEGLKLPGIEIYDDYRE